MTSSLTGPAPSTTAPNSAGTRGISSTRRAGAPTGQRWCNNGLALSHTTAIFAQDEEQARLAEGSKLEIQKGFEKPLVTPVAQGAAFYPAEDYHQDNYLINPIRYRFYRWSCGRDARLEELLGSGH